VTFRASADVYDRHVGRYAPRLSAAMIAAPGVARGERVLDVGCGPGGLTRALADLLGADAVAAVDPSDTIVDACRERVPSADVRLARAEALPFADGTFDVVLSQLVINFLEDADAGLSEMRRVAKPGGTVAGCVWDYADGMRMLRTFWDAAIELDPAAPDEGETMRSRPTTTTSTTTGRPPRRDRAVRCVLRNARSDRPGATAPSVPATPGQPGRAVHAPRAWFALGRADEQELNRATTA
jgi:SAM-dependent methyltransferase